MCGEAENGRDAVEMAQRLHPDAILLDLAMPIMNGLDAARLLSRLLPQTALPEAADPKTSRTENVSDLTPR